MAGGGEIDIFEAVGQRPTVVEQLIHGYAPTGTGKNGDDTRGKPTFLSGTDVSEWHSYAVDWDPSPTTGYMAWSIDGVLQNEVHADEVGAMWTSLTVPHSILLDLGVGGWAGEPDASIFPATMLVDYVRVYRTPQN